MEHEEAIRLNLTEQYLLDELSGDAREAFEEHYFGCQECAEDVRAGAVFVANSRVVLAEGRNPGPIPAPNPRPEPTPWWLAWLRPTLAAPALAAVIALAGFQQYRIQVNSRPVALAWGMLNVDTAGAEDKTISVPAGEGFLLMVRIPSGASHSTYVAELSGPNGKVERIPIQPGQAAADSDVRAIQVPSSNRQSGMYTLVVRGVNAANESKEIGRTSFELKVQ